MVITAKQYDELQKKPVSVIPNGVFLVPIYGSGDFKIVNFDNKPCNLKGVLDPDEEEVVVTDPPVVIT